jgi:thiol-disulfide isomerase/thioredoxin
MRKLLAVVILLAVANVCQAKRVAMFFGATWCPHCQQMKPAIERAKRDGYDVRVLDMDETKAAQLAAALELSKIPAVAVFDEQPDGSLTVKDAISRKMSDSDLRRYLRKWEIPKKESSR